MLSVAKVRMIKRHKAATVSVARLKERDFEVLAELRSATDYRLSHGDDGFVRPLDCGGTDGSDHSYRLTRLAHAGMAEQRQRGSLGRRGSKTYRITDAGRAALGASN